MSLSQLTSFPFCPFLLPIPAAKRSKWLPGAQLPAAGLNHAACLLELPGLTWEATIKWKTNSVLICPLKKREHEYVNKELIFHYMVMKRDAEARAKENHHFHHCHQQQCYGLYLENPSNLHAVFLFKLIKMRCSSTWS